VVGYFFSQLFLLAGKPIFNVVNTAVFCAFIYLVTVHITGKLRTFNPALFLIISASFWMLIPVWGENFLWLSGSTNYLWTTTLILLFLIPLRLNYDNNAWNLGVPLSILYFFLGTLAGCSNENSGAAILLFLVVYALYKIVNKNKFRLFEILGFAGFLIGFTLLISSPGHSVRMEIIRAYGWGYMDYPTLEMLFNRFIFITKTLWTYHGFLLLGISAFLAFDLIYHRKKKLHLFSYLYALMAIVGTYSMVLAPFFPSRVFLVIAVFLIITLGHILSQTDLKIPNIIKRNSVIIVSVVTILFSVSIIHATRDILQTYVQWHERIEYIYAEKNKGNFDLEVAPIHAHRKHNALFGLSDVSANPEDWNNGITARYFGLNSIAKNYKLYNGVSLRKNMRRLFTRPQITRPQNLCLENIRKSKNEHTQK